MRLTPPNPEAWSWRARAGAGALSGVLLAAGFPPFNQGWIALVALVPMVLAFRGAGIRASAGAAAAFGGAFFAILMYWISLFGVLALVLLTIAAMVYLGVFGAMASVVGRRGSVARIVGWPLVWTGMEIARASWPVGGLAWGDLGYAQIEGTMLPLARIVGVHGLGLAIFAVNVLIAEFLVTRPERRAVVFVPAVLALGPMLLPLGLAGPAYRTFDIAAVQGNVPREAFRGFGAGRVGPEDTEIVENHLAVTRRLLSQTRPDLIVWPENALDRDPRRNPEMLDPIIELIGQIGSPIVLPAILEEGEGFTNSNLLIDQAGTARGRYDKVHLVPFGEYVPIGFARTLVPALAAEVPFDGIPGERPVPFDVGGARIGTLICFESTYAPLARALVAEGSEVLIVTTNNASYQDSPASEQHLGMTRMRAVEHGRFVVQAAISGISAIIEADGSVREKTGLFHQALLRDEVPLTTGRTPYSRYGGLIETAILLAAAALVLAGAMRRVREGR